MAAKHHLSLLLLLTLLCSLHTHARVSQMMFSKVIPQSTLAVPSNVVHQSPPTTERPSNFIPGEYQQEFTSTNDSNSYGLYSHESVQFPPSPITHEPNKKVSNYPYNPQYLTENFNPVAYVTPVHHADAEFSEKLGDAVTTTDNYKNRNGDLYSRSQETESSTAGWNDRSFNNYNNYNYENDMTGEGAQNLQRQGMSDTRFLENGKYHYDVKTEKSSRSPYENAMEYFNSANQRYDTNDEYPDDMEEQQYIGQEDSP